MPGPCGFIGAFTPALFELFDCCETVLEAELGMNPSCTNDLWATLMAKYINSPRWMADIIVGGGGSLPQPLLDAG